MSAITAVLFDLDGLLADTEPPHRQAYRDVLAPHGVEIGDAEYGEYWIRRGLGIREFVERRGLTLNPDALRAAKGRRYLELVAASAAPMPGAAGVLERLHGRKTLALASASYPDAVAGVVDRLGFRRFFALIASRGDVRRVKPFPDLFLFAAGRLGVPPPACVVIEDAEKGIRAAQAAGMRSVAVPNEHTRGNDFSAADLVVGSLDEISAERLDALA